MKFSVPTLQTASLALLISSPAAALAQQAGPSPDGAPPGAAAMGTPSPQQQAAMQADRLQHERLRQEARAQILADLTPQHRAQFAAIVGQLAIAAVPDPSSAAKQLDTLLSVRESRAILATATSEREAARTLMQSEHAQFEASLTPAERERMQAHMEQMKAMRANRPAPVEDAGEILLHTALGFERMHGGPPGAR